MNRFIVAAFAVIVVLMTIAVAQAMHPNRAEPGAGYWHTSGTRILDARGEQVRIAGVTWYGMETSYWVPAGLDYQSYKTIMSMVHRLGYNAIRLPYSNEMVESNPVVTQHVRANPHFLGMHALQVLDAIVRYAHRIGLKIILDDHLSAATRPKTVNYLTEPLWYTATYSQASWIRDWVDLAWRYKGNDAVIGFDLRNEPHTNGPGPWNLHAYLNQGSTWGPYQGTSNTASDWRQAAEAAGNAVLAVNPRLLMFVEGVQIYLNPTSPTGVETYWWGSDLASVRTYPIVFDVPHQLVYSPHDWGPWKYNMKWFHNMNYASMRSIWHARWSYIVQDSTAKYAAPVWIGEFGTCTNVPKCVDRQRPSNQATWFHLLLRYLHDNPQVGWSFYALNGTNANNHATRNGLLDPTWSHVANQHLQDDLQSIQG